MKKTMLVVCLAAMLAACGGEGESTPVKRPSGAINGTAFDNLLKDADVYAYSLDGELLGQGKTDEKGLYSIALESVKAQPIKLIARNGEYTEEFSNKLIELKDGDFLVAIVNYTEGKVLSTSLTYLTTLAAGYAEYLIGVGTPSEKAINKANAAISEWAGVDINHVTPVDILDVQSAAPQLTKGLRYSFITAAVSATTAQMSTRNAVDMHVIYNSITFARLAYKDIAYDGILNGVDENGVISMGIVPFTEKTYRQKHALNMLAVANSEHNKTGITPQELAYTAEQLNNSNNAIFGGKTPVPFDSQIPIVQVPSLQEGGVIFGYHTLNFNVSDLIGIESITVRLDDQPVIGVLDVKNPTVNINTNAVDDGEHTLIIEAVNSAGGKKIFKRGVIVSNSGISISGIHPRNGETIKGEYTFLAQVTDPIGVQSVQFIFDKESTYTPDGELDSPFKAINTPELLAKEGEHKLVITATNRVGVSVSEEVTFKVDNTPPVFYWLLNNGAYLTGVYDFSAFTSDNLGLASARYYIDGELLMDVDLIGDEDSVTATHSLNTQGYLEGEHTLVYEVFDNAGAVKRESKQVFVDWARPSVNIQTGSGTISKAFTFKFTATDTNGIDRIELFVDGARVNGGILPAGATSLKIDPTPYSEGNKIVKVIAYDKAGKSSSSVKTINFQHKKLGFPSRFPVKYGAINHVTVTNADFGDIQSITSCATCVQVTATSTGLQYSLPEDKYCKEDKLTRHLRIDAIIKDPYGNTYVVKRDLGWVDSKCMPFEY